MGCHLHFAIPAPKAVFPAGCDKASPLQVRRKEIEDKMEYQFKQGMTAPDWEMDDYGWCAFCPRFGLCCSEVS